MSDPIRIIMSLVDEHKTDIPESVYLEICDNLKRLYASGDTVRDNYTRANHFHRARFEPTQGSHSTSSRPLNG